MLSCQKSAGQCRTYSVAHSNENVSMSAECNKDCVACAMSAKSKRNAFMHDSSLAHLCLKRLDGFFLFLHPLVDR